MTRTKVTIQTIADEAGVSIKTVSRVLNKEASVRESTRAKVQAVIDRFAYEPSPAARALASNKSKIIGLIYDNPSAAYILDIQTGVLEACYERDYNLVIHPCQHDSPGLIDELINLVSKSRLDGLVLSPPLSHNEELISALLDREISVSCIAPTVRNVKISSVVCNDEEAVEEVINFLINQGHTQIGFVQGFPSHGASRDRFSGYRKALSKSNIQLNDDFIVQGDFSFESGLECGRRLLKLEHPPTAIFASNDYMAAGVLKCAHNLSIKVPDDLAIVGFDDAPVSRQIGPSLTTIKQPVVQMGKDAAELLIAKILNPKVKTEQREFVAEIIIREST